LRLDGIGKNLPLYRFDEEKRDSSMDGCDLS
jgi:hypothetical protein